MLALKAAARPDSAVDFPYRREQAQESQRAMKAILAGLDDMAKDEGLARRIAAKTRQPVEQVQAALDNGWEPPEALME